jgi:uncharacterized lipoprotein YajG
MKSLALLVLALLLACCTSPKTLIVVKNPTTGQVAQCQDDARLFGSAARVESCAKAYEKDGWIRLSE